MLKTIYLRVNKWTKIMLPTNHSHTIYIYIYIYNLALNNQQGLTAIKYNQAKQYKTTQH